MISFADMPARLEAAGLKRVSAQRCRQLAEEDPNWPVPLEAAQKVGRVRLFNWQELEPYFRRRTSRQGQRTDRARPSTTTEDATMGYDRKSILITARVSRHNSDQDRVDDELFEQLSTRISRIIAEPQYESIEPSLDEPY